MILFLNIKEVSISRFYEKIDLMVFDARINSAAAS